MIRPRSVVATLCTCLASITASAQVCTSWTFISDNAASDPADRLGHAMVYDRTRDRMVMFSGSYNVGSDQFTWFYQAGAWTGILTNPSPAARDSHAMAYDSQRDKVVLFGGQIGSTSQGDTWEYDGNVWLARPGAGPIARSHHSMVYDSRRCRTVLFGGYSTISASPLNDTWEWDGTQWHQMSPTTSPPPNLPVAQMAYDQARGVTVLRTDEASLLGSSDVTWEWDGTDWTAVTLPGSPQLGLAGMTYDERREVVVLFAGGRGTVDLNDYWEYDGKAWNKHTDPVAPSPRRLPTVAYNPIADRTVMFGGQGGPFPYTLGDTWEHNDTRPAITNQPESTTSPSTGTATLSVQTLDATSHQWRYNGVPISDNLIYTGTNTPTLTISGLNVPTFPTGDYDCVVSNTCGQVISHPAHVDASDCHPTWVQNFNAVWIPRAAHAQAYNANFNQTVMHGGRNASGLALADTWTFNGSSWNPVFTVPNPPHRFNHVMATHQASGSTIMCGGTNSLNNVFNDVWLWNSFSWTQLPPGPPALHSAAMSYDSFRQKLVLFGGTNGATISADTYEWDPVNGWVAVLAPGPKGRYAHSMAFDLISGKTVMHGGFDGIAVSDETWEYDGSAWRLRSTQGPPPATDMAMAYDQRIGAVILSGDFTGTGSGQTWKWDSATARWIELTDTNAPAKRDHAMSYHAATQQMISTNGIEPPAGAHTSTTASMSPPAAPDITQIIPNPTLIKVNKPFTLTAVATGANLSYQWFKDSFPLISSPTLSGVNGPVLSFTNAVMATSGAYSCVVSSPCGSDSVDIAVNVICLADVNGDNLLTPADFTAWLAAFNAQLPAADQNCDGLYTPADFTAWLANFNAGCP